MLLKLVAISFVFLGVIALFSGLCITRRIIQEAIRHRAAWYTLYGLIVIFMIGYLVYSGVIWYQPNSATSLMVALVFVGGGGFVFLIAKLSAATIGDVKRVTVLKMETEKIRSVKQRLETILNNAAEGIITFDKDGYIDGINAAGEDLFGYGEAEIIGQMVGSLLSCEHDGADKGARLTSDKAFRDKLEACIGHEGEVYGHLKDGSIRPLSLKLSRMEIGGQEMYTGLIADISERKAMLEHFKNLAEHDGLTGLHNRNYFQHELVTMVKRIHRGDIPQCAVMYIDLDNFKYVNDTLGHAAGDRLLIQISEILSRRARETDILARFGGDEFTVLLFNVSSTKATRIADSFREQIAEFIFKEGGDQVDIGCSIGVSIINRKTKTAEEAMSQADFACHQAKHGGRNRIRMFNLEDQVGVSTMSQDMSWSRRIKSAIENQNFVLACQPIVSTADGEISNFEVLVRMLDEQSNIIMPGGFLPAAERFGLIVDIDKWVIINAINTLAKQRIKKNNLCYAINLSAQTLTHPGICELIENQLAEVKLDPGALTFEITETAAISDMNAAETLLSNLRSMGCKTALDDFGTGLSSFAYLKDLPVDVVKIDGRFVKNIADNNLDLAMVKAMNDIVHAMGKKTVAEFVESKRCFEILKSYGIDYGQGYYLGRPKITKPEQFEGEMNKIVFGKLSKITT